MSVQKMLSGFTHYSHSFSPLYGQFLSSSNPQNATDINDRSIIASGDAVLVLWSVSGVGILCIELAIRTKRNVPFAVVYIAGSLCVTGMLLQLLIGGADLALLSMSMAQSSSFQFDTM